MAAFLFESLPEKLVCANTYKYMESKLYRSRTNRIIAGVASGLAQYFNIDPILVRLFFVAAMFGGGSGFWIYIILWIIVPEEPYVLPQENKNQTQTDAEVTAPTTTDTSTTSTTSTEVVRPTLIKNPSDRGNGFGLILIIVGLLFLAQNTIPNFHIGQLWPIILIAIGLSFILNSNTRS
ncbi:PspC domain-containing protein [candidate division WWE3 bacterium]|nr:PspC domain-containing protein [candidate division WWE3 bacterium]